MAAKSEGHAGEGICQAGVPPHCWTCHITLVDAEVELSSCQCRLSSSEQGVQGLEQQLEAAALQLAEQQKVQHVSVFPAG